MSAFRSLRRAFCQRPPMEEPHQTSATIASRLFIEMYSRTHWKCNHWRGHASILELPCIDMALASRRRSLALDFPQAIETFCPWPKHEWIALQPHLPSARIRETPKAIGNTC